jgi:hypothetical protein
VPAQAQALMLAPAQASLQTQVLPVTAKVKADSEQTTVDERHRGWVLAEVDSGGKDDDSDGKITVNVAKGTKADATKMCRRGG